MAIKDRIPQSERDKKELMFISTIEQDNLKTLTLEQLAQRFDDIEQQGQLMQGRILVEARDRLGSDKEFGRWCASHAICVGSQQHRNRLIHLARFFDGRELDKISISAAYEISAPANADIALEVYEYAKGKNLPIAEVRKQIAMKKGVTATNIKPVMPEAVAPIPETIISTDLKSRLKNEIGDTPIMEVLRVLKELIDEFQGKLYRK